MTKADAEFLAIFRDEAHERLEHIVDALLAVEAGRAPADALDALFRDIHTLKGSAGMVGLHEIRRLAHAVEDVLQAGRERGAVEPTVAEPLLRATDVLRDHVEGDGQPVDALIAELTALASPSQEEPLPAPTPPAPEATHRKERRSIRVSPEKIDAVLDLVGETVLHRRRLEHVLSSGGDAEQRVSDELDAGGRLLDDLKSAAIGMRTLPLATIVGSLPRAVRDLAIEAGKQVELIVHGSETELDRAILERLTDVLVHVIGNSVAHGIELPEEREHAGKPLCGRVVLRAEQRGGVVEITVADDGRGVSQEALDAVGPGAPLADVLAAAGYSTAGSVTGISGRGVGLDAVKEQVESFGGSLEVHSEPGAGTEVVMRLPLALALIEVLLVERGDVVYGVPLPSVEEAIAIGELLSLGGSPAIELRGQALPVVDLAQLVGGDACAIDRGAPAIVLNSGGRRVAAVCDELHGKDEVVVKPLGPLLSSLSAYLGASILGDGRIALLLDPATLVHGNFSHRASGTPSPSEPAPAQKPRARTVLVVEDSLAVRELQRGILETAGYGVRTARSGREALEHLEREASVDLIVTDIEMPEMGGIELTEAIRADPDRASLPVVVVSSLGSENDRRRGIEAGADAYMVKDAFDQQLLLETVERLLGR